MLFRSAIKLPVIVCVVIKLPVMVLATILFARIELSAILFPVIAEFAKRLLPTLIVMIAYLLLCFMSMLGSQFQNRLVRQLNH